MVNCPVDGCEATSFPTISSLQNHLKEATNWIRAESDLNSHDSNVLMGSEHRYLQMLDHIGSPGGLGLRNSWETRQLRISRLIELGVFDIYKE